MNFEALPYEAQEALKSLFYQLDQKTFDAEEAMQQGLLFVLAAVRSRMVGVPPSLYRKVEELASLGKGV